MIDNDSRGVRAPAGGYVRGSTDRDAAVSLCTVSENELAATAGQAAAASRLSRYANQATRKSSKRPPWHLWACQSTWPWPSSQALGDTTPFHQPQCGS
jgi:hypothetical protein